MARKKQSIRFNKGRIKRLIPMAGLIGLLIVGGIFLNNSGSASANTTDTYYRAKIEANVLNSSANADGSDCVNVIISAFSNNQ